VEELKPILKILVPHLVGPGDACYPHSICPTNIYSRTNRRMEPRNMLSGTTTMRANPAVKPKNKLPAFLYAMAKRQLISRCPVPSHPHWTAKRPLKPTAELLSQGGNDEQSNL